MADEVITWYPVSSPPQSNTKCLVHALNQWFVIAVWNSNKQQFFDKDSQPVAAPIEWSYRVNRGE